MTPERVQTLSDDQLWQVFENCRTNRSDKAKALMADIEALIIDRANVSVGETGVKLAEPFGKLMALIINSAEAIAAAEAATAAGEPAMTGVEPFLVERLGLSYAKRYEATIQAGTLVRKMMDRRGFIKSGRKAAMPAGSVAKTAEIYHAKSA
jgi:hypothetical protein